MQKLIALAIVLAAIAVMILAGLAARKKNQALLLLGRAGRGPRSGRSRTAGGRPEEEELVAVITAAVAAASGLAMDAFRIVNLRPARESTAQRGFNTPLWGHIDRYSLGEWK
jgi:hypothetical protein